MGEDFSKPSYIPAAAVDALQARAGRVLTSTAMPRVSRAFPIRGATFESVKGQGRSNAPHINSV